MNAVQFIGHEESLDLMGLLWSFSFIFMKTSRPAWEFRLSEHNEHVHPPGNSTAHLSGSSASNCL